MSPLRNEICTLLGLVFMLSLSACPPVERNQARFNTTELEPKVEDESTINEWTCLGQDEGSLLSVAVQKSEASGVKSAVYHFVVDRVYLRREKGQSYSLARSPVFSELVQPRQLGGEYLDYVVPAKSDSLAAGLVVGTTYTRRGHGRFVVLNDWRVSKIGSVTIDCSRREIRRF